MRIVEYKLPVTQFGRNPPELCYTRAKNRVELYHDTAPRLHIATVYFGDNGWIYTPHTDKLRAPYLGDTFVGWRQAMSVAFHAYAWELRVEKSK